MKNELFPFQKGAVWDLRKKAAWALDAYRRTGAPQILSLQAPTGSGKTIMMASLIESVLCGSSEVPPDEPTGFAEQPEAIFVWLSDSPELNEQSKEKIDLMADRIRYGQTTTIEGGSTSSTRRSCHGPGTSAGGATGGGGRSGRRSRTRRKRRRTGSTSSSTKRTAECRGRRPGGRRRSCSGS